METISRPRKHWTPAQREEILDRYRNSQLTQKQFVAQAGIALSTLTSWLRKAQRHPSAGSSFLALPNLLGTPTPPATYRLQLPQGLSLEVRSGFNPAELALWLERLPVR